MAVALSLKFAQRGHEVDVVCLDRSSGSSHERLFLSALNEHRVSPRFLGRRIKWPGLMAALKLWWLVQRRQYDIVHSHLSMPDAITGLIRRVTGTCFRHVLTVHSTLEPRSAIRAAFAGGGNIVYCSQAAQNMSRPLPSVSNMVIPNGITQSAYSTPCAQRAQTRQQLKVPEDSLVVILVGRMSPQKNFDLAIDALRVLHERARYTNLRCLFCGDGQERPQLEAKAMRSGLNGVIQFCGSRTDMAAILGASDVFLSTSDYEGMPLAVLEALSAGLPCVLSSIDEHYEVAGAMPGCMFAPSHDSEEVASALEAMLDKRISVSALKRGRDPLLEKFSIDVCAKSYISLYESLCHS